MIEVIGVILFVIFIFAIIIGIPVYIIRRIYLWITGKNIPTNRVSRNIIGTEDDGTINSQPEQNHTTTEGVRTCYTAASRSSTETFKFFQSFYNWTKDHIIEIIGALFILSAVSWFFDYDAFIDIIGPEGKIFLGLALGLIPLIFGYFKIETRKNLSEVLTILGSSIITWSVFYTRADFVIFAPSTSILIILALTIYLGYLSITYKSTPLHLGSFILASYAPYGSKGLEISNLHAFIYQFFITIGSIWVSMINGNRGIILASTLFTSIILANLLSSNDLSRQLNINILHIYFAIMLIINILMTTKHYKNKIWIDIGINLLNSLFLLGLIFEVHTGTERTLALAAWTVIFGLSSAILYSETQVKQLITIHSSSAFLFCTALIILESSKYIIAPLFAVLAIILPVAVYFIYKNQKASFALTCAGLVLALLSSNVNFAATEWSSQFSVLNFIAIVVIISSFIATTYFYHTYIDRPEKNIAYIAEQLAIVLTLALIGRIVANENINHNISAMVNLISIAAAGTFGIIYGRGKSDTRSKIYKYTGSFIFVIFLLTAINFRIEKNMSTEYAVITAIIIGLILLSSAFVSKPDHNKTKLPQ